MKKLLIFLLSALMLLSLCACGGDSDDVAFRNDLKVKIDSIYISPSEEETWSDPLNYAKLSPGSKIYISFSKLENGAGTYDIGAVDENNMNYDVYEVELKEKDVIALSASGDQAVVTVTSADGASKTYYGYIYEGEE